MVKSNLLVHNKLELNKFPLKPVFFSIYEASRQQTVV